MKKLTRKIGAGVLAATLIMGSSLVAFAADVKTGTSGGTGSIEGIVETDVFKADLPTEAANAYNYIVDPQGLIRKTDAAKYTGATFGEGSVFFKNTDTSYSDTSNAATIVNKSSAPLKVTVKAKADVGTASGAAALSSAKTFADTDTDLKVYLGLSDSVTGNTEKALTATDTTDGTDAILKAVLGAAPEDAYEYSYANNAYSYAIKSDVSGFKFAEYSFQITGVANEKAAWKADTALPTVSVTWDVDLAAAGDTVTVETPEQTAPVVPTAPTAPATATYSKANGAEIVVDLGAGNLAAEGVAKIQAKNAASDALYDASSATYADGKVTITSAQWPAAPVGSQRWVVITFDDDAATEKTVVVTIAE